MPNWCSTTYVLEGSKKELSKWSKALKEIQTEGKDWMGYVIQKVLPNVNVEDRSLRSFLVDYSVHRKQIHIYCNEAWGVSDFPDIINDDEDSEVFCYYMAEEPGCGVYVTNDAEQKHFPEKYKVEIGESNDTFSEYFTNKEEMFHYINYVTGSKVHNTDDICELNERNRKEGVAWQVSVYEFIIE